MTYSATVRAATPHEAHVAVAAEFDRQTAGLQHYEDHRLDVLMAVEGQIGALSWDESKHVVVFITGYLCGTVEDGKMVVTSASNTVNAALVPAEAK